MRRSASIPTSGSCPPSRYRSLFGVLVYYAVLRPVIGRTHVVQIFTTLGLSIVLQNAALMLWTANFRQLQLPYADRVIAVAGAACRPCRS